MLDRSSKEAPSDVSDPLTEMLRGLRLDGVEYGRCRLAEPWATSFPAQEAARFHFISSGNAWLQTPSGEWLQLRQGDAALLPRGDAHVIASLPGLAPLPFDRFGRKEVCQGVFDVQCADACGGTVALTASMRFNIDKLHPLLQLMPEAMLTSDLARNEPSIPHLLDAMAREVDMDRVGAGGILARLADVLTATLIRTWVEHGCGDTTGWIAAVRNPDVGRVLAAIHLQPERDWNIASLARLMGASRSGFAERFLRVVGETPARYVARVRMHQARQWLRDGERVATVAERLGYDAEASFSRAFKRIIGTPPSHFRGKAEGEAIRDFG
ncbi:AraC family transcriptional regulator [Neorhizobium galegae]|uniref:AraC family transcriptional regulator n=1 Tax=Neorhizobium galegae TaxID=399 RepID=UPI000621E617|nr:AraC family transcriptional regulator [Neorhizobium galegae]CDZ29292.1 Transcriptional regulator, AraC family [Neorhizobium galegae bv. officinalis]KAA9387083.1 AraC family transcriptional regulator [Neorhizobium galegae]KAB1116196.1 AraC family transcriptional regulator [Neorhizobium galegae]MCM2501674.1 AraC family transcriptional regulator [Neorhizobium galegae]MCQ1771420.1 AraC family transcriptional regulator [Neorhizobium galegae]